MQRAVKILVLSSGLLAVACGGGSGGGSSPTAPSATTTSTFTGTVTNIVTGAVVSDATITIGTVSATSTTDGTYSLTVTAAGTPSFSAAASGFFTRVSVVSMSGSKTINPEIIPQGDGFNLAVYNQRFRDNNNRGTARWTSQPTYVIFSQEFDCIELTTDGNACMKMQAKEANAPAFFETNVRASIAKAAQLTGNVIGGAPITTKTHPVGTILYGGDWGMTVGTISFIHLTGLYSRFSAGAWGDPNDKVNLSYSGDKSPSERGTSHDFGIHLHEVGHALGYGHPDGAGNMLEPGIMGPFPYQFTSVDELHGRILYKRPNGSLTPDRDPAGTTIN